MFYNKFRALSEELGVKLAPPGDKDKDFDPSQQGTVLGVYYDTVAWSWSIKDDKLSIILNKLQDCIENEVMSLREITLFFFCKNKVYKNTEPQIWSNVKNIFDAQISKFFNCS